MLFRITELFVCVPIILFTILFRPFAIADSTDSTVPKNENALSFSSDNFLDAVILYFSRSSSSSSYSSAYGSIVIDLSASWLIIRLKRKRWENVYVCVSLLLFTSRIEMNDKSNSGIGIGFMFMFCKKRNKRKKKKEKKIRHHVSCCHRGKCARYYNKC